MKRNGKSSTPIIAAHAKKNNGHNGTNEKMKPLVLERISDGILAFDAGMNHVYVNERAGEILGREPQTLLGKNFWEEYPESTGSPFAAACQRAFETQTVVPFDGYFPPSQARFEGRVYPSSDGLSVLISDHANAKREGDLNISQFPPQNPNPVMRFRSDGKLLYANPASAALLASWKGRTEQVLPSDVQELLSVVLETHSNQEIEIENQGKTYSCLLVPVPESEYVNLYFSDITERKQAQEALARERELLERILESMPVMLSMYDPATQSQRLNRQFKQLTGWDTTSARELVEACYPNPEYRREVIQRMQKCEPNEWVDVQMQTRDGSTLDTTWSNITFSNGIRVGLGIDITERKRVEEKYRRIVETANEGIWEIDRDTRTVFVNQRMAEMLGYTPEEMMGRSSFEFVFPEDYSDGQNRLAHAKTGSAVSSDEFRYHRKDGSELWTVISITPKLDAQGNFTGAVAMMSDITERKQDERALMEFARQQTALYQLVDQLHRANTLEDVFNSSLDAITNALQCDRASILLFDETRTMHFVAWRGLSDEYRKATDGHSPWKYAEKNPAPIYFNDVETSDLSDSLKAVIKKEGIRSLAFIPLVYQGNLIGKFMVYFNELHVFNNTELDLSLTIGRQLASGVDRKRAEEALQQSEERFARFMQYLPGLAWIKDVHGHYVYANAAAEKAFNTPQEQLYGRSDQEVFSAQVASQFKQNDKQALLEGRGVQVVETMEQDDGVIHHSLVTKFPIPGPDGKTALIGGTAFDITDRIQMEDALRQARKHAEQTADRLARLQEVTASLAGSAIPMQLAEQILEQGTRATGAASGILSEYDGQGLKTIAELGYPEGTVRAEPLSLSEPTPMSDCIRTGRAVWIKTQEEFAAHYPHLVEFRRNTGHESMVALPLIVGDRTLGGLAFSFTEQREFLLEERGFFLAVAQQCAQALERAHVEEARRESEERYRAIVNQATAGIVRKDAQGRLLFANDAFCQMLGYSNSELMNKTMWQLTHEADVHENQRLYNRLMVEGIPFQLEKRLIRRDGSILWATVSVSPVLDSAGKPQSAVSVYADITERKQVEVALNESRERYRDLFNLVPVAVYTCNADGLIREYNRSAVELWGREPNIYDPEERYCGSVKIYHPDGRFMPHDDCPMARMLRGETLDPSELEILVERPDGSRRNVIAHPLPLKNEHGEIIGAINCLYDMTERMQAEERLALLGEVSELTRNIDVPEELMSAVANVVGRHLQVKRCLFNEIDMENDREIVHHDYHPGTQSVAGVHKITEYSSVTTLEMAEGKTVVNADSKTDPRTANDFERSYVPNGERAYIAVPLMRNENWVASLWVSDDTPRQWSEAEVSLLQTVAERTWTATEKLRINAALRDSEERDRAIINQTTVGIVRKDADGNLIFVNQAFCEMVGYHSSELIGTSMWQLTHPDDVGKNRELYNRLMAEGIPFQFEKRLIHKDGSILWARVSVSPLLDAEDKPQSAVSVYSDITLRRLAEAELQRLNLELEERVKQRTAELEAANEFLRESEATARLILESMPDAILIADKDGQVVYGNAQVESLFGYSSKEVIGQPVEMLIPERFHENHVGHRHAYNGQRQRRSMGLSGDMFGRRKDNSEFPVDVMLSPISNNTTWDVMVTIRDNTEQKQAQQALRANEEKLRKLFEILPVGVSFLNNEGQITEMNTALTHILGLSKRQLLDAKFKPRQYIRSDGSPMPPSEFASVRAHTGQKTVYNVETGIIKENGETIWTSVNAAPVDIADVDIVVTTIDITERKKAEVALHKNRERLRILSRRLVEVQEEERRALARELHDRVGQNLAALNLNLNILRGQLSTDALQIIGSRLNDSVTLVNQILTITRSVMSDLRSNVLDDYGLESALHEFADQFTLRTGVQVVTDKQVASLPRLDPNIEMTLLRIAQEALTNVARHAQAKQATVSISVDADAVYMSIQDDGIGILSWQRANQPSSHGLQIIRERAEAFGGSLQIHSTYKKGTRIEVKIPLGNVSPYKVAREKRS